MHVYKLEKIACNVCLDVLAEWRVKPNDDVASPVPVWLLCFLRHVFQLAAEVAVCPSAC